MEYGPANVDVLKQWVSEGRLQRTSSLRDFSTGEVLAAERVPGLFTLAAPPPQVPAAGAVTQVPTRQPNEMGVLWGVIARSVLGLVLFFVLKGLGLVVCGYGLLYAIQAKANGNRYGMAAILISAIALAVIGVGWMLRLNGTHV